VVASNNLDEAQVTRTEENPEKMQEKSSKFMASGQISAFCAPA